MTAGLGVGLCLGSNVQEGSSVRHIYYTVVLLQS
jgi:hypothetical protein